MKPEHHKLLLDIVLWGLVFVLLGVSAILGWIVLPVVLILDFRQIWQDATSLERKEILQRLVKHVDVDGKQIVKVCPQEDFRQVLQACASSYPITIGF